MSIIVGEVIAVSGVRISLRIFEDSNHETIYYGGVKYRVDWPHESPDSWYHLN